MSVRVAVRCRPLNSRERELGSACIVEMSPDGRTTLLHDAPSSVATNSASTTASATTGATGSTGGGGGTVRGGKPRQFTYDHSFWSVDREDAHFAPQDAVYDAVGREVLVNAFAGYNACVFAYGQTGAGKSFSMMGGGSGDDEQRGLIPRLCEDLFGRMKEREAGSGGTWTAKVEVSYMEIYLEKVKDLLNPASKHNLRVRENVSTGPYVESLSFHAVNNFGLVKALMEDGNKVRWTGWLLAWLVLSWLGLACLVLAWVGKEARECTRLLLVNGHKRWPCVRLRQQHGRLGGFVCSLLSLSSPPLSACLSFSPSQLLFFGFVSFVLLCSSLSLFHSHISLYVLFASYCLFESSSLFVSSLG